MSSPKESSPEDTPRDDIAPDAPDAPAPDGARLPFWRAKPLSAMSATEWESLCDGCGRCCLVKLEDEDTGQVAYTDVACRLLDAATCRCSDYERRSEIVSDCVRLTPESVAELNWLPPTCAYRLVGEGKDLPFWHPLVSGDAGSVAAAGITVSGKVAGSENEFGLFELVDHIVAWPVRWPRGAKGGAKTGVKTEAKAPTGARARPRRPKANDQKD